MAKQEKSKQIDKQVDLLREKLNELLPCKAFFHLDKIINCQSPLKSEEYLLSTKASAGRKLEFIAGRNSLKSSLQSIHHESFTIAQEKNGAPILPNNIVGSLSHKYPLVLSVCANASDYIALGVDIERDTPLKPGAASTFLSENDQIANQNILVTQEMLEVVLFCIKESTLKALLSMNKKNFAPSFYDISVQLKPRNGFVLDSFIQWKDIILYGVVFLQSPWIVSITLKQNV